MEVKNSEKSCWVMRQILDNALVAEERRSPLCDDTGIPHLFLEVGKNRSVTGELLEQIKEGGHLVCANFPVAPWPSRVMIMHVSTKVED